MNRQPRGIPVGGEFAANEHDEAPGVLGASEIEDVKAGDVRAGDVVFFSTFKDGRDVDEPHTVTRVERLIGLDRREQVRLSFDGVPAESLGEGAGVYWSTADLRVTPAPRETGRTPREIAAEIKTGQRKLEYLEPGDEFSQDEQDAMVAAALDPGVDGMAAARAKRAADTAEARNFHTLAIRLRAAAERHRLSEDPMSRMNDPYSIAASPDTPADLVIQAVKESPSDAVTRNPNAPAEALDILARYEKVQEKHNMGWLRNQITAHPHASAETRAEVERINARLLLGN